MNRRLLKCGLASFLVLGFLAGCASNKKVEEKLAEKAEAKVVEKADAMQAPQWFTTPPKDEKSFYGVATATSKDLQLALDKASTDARAEIGRQVEFRVQSLQKKFNEEIGVGDNAQLTQMFTKISKLVVSTSLSGSKIKDQKFQQEGALYRAFSLVEYPAGVGSRELLNQIKNQKEMYTRFRDSEAYKELDEEAKRYEEWKKQQDQ